MFKYVIAVLFFLGGNSHGYTLLKRDKSPKSFFQIKKILSKYKVKTLEGNLRVFVKSCRPSRMAGSFGHKNAAPFLVNFLKEVDSENTSLLSVDTFVPDLNKARKMYEGDFKREIVGKYQPQSETYKKWDRFTKSILVELGNLKKVTGKNIIWEKKGTINPEEILIIGAHYDTIAFDKKKTNCSQGSRTAWS